MKFKHNEESITFGELSRDFYYANLLVDNIMAENLAEVTRLLESKKANPNLLVPELGIAPLHLLAGLENEDFTCRVTHQVLRNGGDPNVRSDEGLTPVHVAAMWGRCKVLEVLLAFGGDPDLIDDIFFLTAEEYARKEHQWKAYGVLCTSSIMVNGYKDLILEGKLKSENHSSPYKPIKDTNIRKLKSEERNHSDSSENDHNRCMYSVVKKEKKQNELDFGRHSEKNQELFSPDEDVRGQMMKKQSRKSKKYDGMNMLDDSCLDESDSIHTLKLSEKAVKTISRQRKKTNIYESLGDIPSQVLARDKPTGKYRKYNKSSQYGDSVSESCDWIRKKGDCIKLDKNTLDTIRNQRLKSKIYETKGVGEDISSQREKSAPLYEESEFCDWVDPRQPEKYDQISLEKMNNHRARTSTYNSEELQESENVNIVCPGPKLPRRNSKKHYRSKDSEVYLCGYAEESVSTNEHKNQIPYCPSNYSEMSNSVDHVNPKMLCKMSRMFLFMLKKRHIYQKIK